MLIYVIVSGFVIYLLNKVWRRYIQKHMTKEIVDGVRDIPSPKGCPILGNLPMFMFTKDFWAEMRRLVRDHKFRLFRLWWGFRCFLVISHPDEAKCILTSTATTKKSIVYLMLKPWLAEGLLTSYGEKWQERRRILTPAFHFQILKKFLPVFDHHSSEFVQHLSGFTNQTIDAIPVCATFILTALCESTMGVKLHHEEKELVEYKNAIHRFGEIVRYRVTNVQFFYDAIFMTFSTLGYELKRLLKTLHSFSRSVIRKRIEERANQMHENNTRHKFMLDLLLSRMDNEKDIDFSGVCEEVDTFMFEGHDTTSNGLTFTLFCLANNPSAQDKIFAELKEIFGDGPINLTYDTLAKMEFMECCIKESLRLYPPVPLISRVIKDKLPIGDFVIPPNVMAIVSIYDMHRNPEFWPDPEKFDPSRFTKDNSLNRNPYCYVPFSAGFRNCIGQKYAMFQLKSFICKVMWDFCLEAVDTPETLAPYFDVVMRVKYGVKIRLKKRV